MTKPFSSSHVFSSSSLSQTAPAAAQLPLSSTRLDDFTWSESDRLGEGRYGQVFKATRRSDNAVVAIKRVHIFDMEEQARHLCLREANLLLHIQHEHIIAILDCFMHHNDLYLVMEYADLGDMAKLIGDMRAKQLRFTEEDMWRFIYCIASALQHMHSRHLMHRDIKPANIYVSRGGEVKVGDLGLGRVMEGYYDRAGSVVGTPYYMSPEVIREEEYDYATDIWSLGCLVYEMAQLQVPFQGDNLWLLGINIQQGNYQPIDNIYSQELIDFVNSLLQKQPALRPTAGVITTRALCLLHQFSTQTQQQAAANVSIATTPSSTTSSSTSPQPSSPSSPLLTSHPAPHSTHSSANPFSEFEDLGVIGRGQYSSVHKARRRSDGRLVAVKQVQIFDMDGASRRECVNETRILSELKHEHIIEYLDYFTHDNDLFLILEYASEGDLSAVIANNAQQQQPMSEQDVWQFTHQISSALAFMHSKRIMHRDIKPANIFICDDHTCKLGDLGLGRFISQSSAAAYSEVGTPFYMSPEAITGAGYSFASDVWSLGCLVYELSMLHSPFYQSTLNYYTLGQRIQQCQHTPLPDTYSVALRQLLASILTPTPEHRPSAEQVSAIAAVACKAFELGVKPDVQIQELPALVEETERRREEERDAANSSRQPSGLPSAVSTASSRIRAVGSDDAPPAASTRSKRPPRPVRTSPATSPQVSPTPSPVIRERRNTRSPSVTRTRTNSTNSNTSTATQLNTTAATDTERTGVLTRSAARERERRTGKDKEEEKEQRMR